MGLHNGVGKGAAPFQYADGKDGETAITGNVSQIAREVSLSLPAKSGNPVRRHPSQNRLGQPKALQEFQPIQKTVHVGRVLPGLELTQPDKPRDRSASVFRQQGIEAGPHGIVQPLRDPGLDPPLRSHKRVRA